MSHIEKIERYQPCRECGFWVKIKDTYCPDCGSITPLWKIPTAKFHISTSAMLTSGSLYFMVRNILAWWQKSGGIIGNAIHFLGGSIAFGIVFGIAWSAAHYFRQNAKQQRLAQTLQRRSKSNLRGNEASITQRLEEMQTREQQIQGTLHEITQTVSTESSQKIIDTLKQSLVALQIQRDRYIGKLWEISLIRWYNTLQPLTENLENVTYELCDARVKDMTEVIFAGNEMLRRWERTPNLTPAQQECITRLQKAITTCEHVQQDLLSHKAALAVKGLSPLDENLHLTPDVLKSLEELDAFNILPEVGEFTSGVKALDDEYFRLQGEEEVYREFEQGKAQ